MSDARKIVLNSLHGYRPELHALISSWIEAGVMFVGVVGQDAERIEDLIDETCVGDGSSPYFMLTTSHPGETLQEVIEFAEMLIVGEYAGPVRVVEF